MKSPLPAVAVALLFATTLAAAPAARPPNIVVIISDDQGYADLSFNPHHPREVSTPRPNAAWRPPAGGAG